MNSRSPKIPANLPSASTAGSPGSPDSITLRVAEPTGSSADNGSTSLIVSFTSESGIRRPFHSRDVPQCHIPGCDYQRQDRDRKADPEEGDEADRLARPLGQPGGGDVGGGGDDRHVAAEVSAQRQRPP